MALSNTGRRMVCRSVIHLRSLQSATNEDLVNCRGQIASRRRCGRQARPYIKIQVQRLIDIRVVSGEKEEERRLRVCVVGVGEAVPDQPC